MATRKEIDPELEYTEEFESIQHPPADIVVFNELRSCADLYRLIETKQLEIKPFFQRDLVWSDAEQTRFIDSLVKQLPIPSLCLGYDYLVRKWIVIDGLQRLSAVSRFLEKDSLWQLSVLKDIDPSLAGEQVKDIQNASNPLYANYERVQNVTLPITVLRCDFSKKDHMEYLFKIFHRLNSGGVRLSNQEIRNCIYSGNFNSRLSELDKDLGWKDFKPHIIGKKDRFRSVELILRMFAFMDNRQAYRGNLTRFLNEFMMENRDMSVADCTARELLFKRITNILQNKVTQQLDGRKIGFSQTEALLVSLGTNIDTVEKLGPKAFETRFKKFLAIRLLTTAELRNDISNRENVITRIQDAIKIFS